MLMDPVLHWLISLQQCVSVSEGPGDPVTCIGPAAAQVASHQPGQDPQAAEPGEAAGARSEDH